MTSSTRSPFAALALLSFSVACTDGSEDPSDDADGSSQVVPLPPVPLHTDSRWIVDRDGHRIKLAGVNWYGAESPDFVPDGLAYNDLDAIAALTRELGFNSVRLPWCNELYEKNPIIADSMLTANPALQGLTALEVLDAVIDALARQGLLVILDNHRSRGDWCCDIPNGDGLWYTEDYPEEVWIAHWEGMAERYRDQPAVVGVDLRNEPRGQLAAGVPPGCYDCDNPTEACVCEWASWGDDTGNNRDWASAAERAGNAVLAIDPDLLIMVEGPHWSSWFGASYRPVELDVPNRVVYSPHAYSMMNQYQDDCPAYKAGLDDNWGYLVLPDRSPMAPVWVGEFGIGHDDTDSPWWNCFLEYLDEHDLDWAYWALNGTQGSGYSRTAGEEEGYGVLDMDWAAPANPLHIEQLQALQPARLGP